MQKFIAGAAALLLTGVLPTSGALAQQTPGSSADTDPVKQGWMQGSPPATFIPMDRTADAEMTRANVSH